MYSLTMHNMDASVYSQIYAIAEREEISLNEVVKRCAIRPRPAKETQD